MAQNLGSLTSYLLTIFGRYSRRVLPLGRYDTLCVYGVLGAVVQQQSAGTLCSDNCAGQEWNGSDTTGCNYAEFWVEQFLRPSVPRIQIFDTALLSCMRPRIRCNDHATSRATRRCASFDVRSSQLSQITT